VPNAEVAAMGWAEYELGGLVKVLGALVILAGIGLAVYEYSLDNKITALVVFLVLLVIGLAMVSWGGFSRKQNTPMGRVEDVRDK
jgi:hypothetical protein